MKIAVMDALTVDVHVAMSRLICVNEAIAANAVGGVRFVYGRSAQSAKGKN